MSSQSLPQNITTQEIMDLDYRYHYSNDELKKDWNKLRNITTYKTGAQFKPGMKLCQHFFPNFWRIKNTKGDSFESCWENEELMNKVHNWGLQSMSKLWMSWIRRAVFLAGGLPNSSYYRPHFSKQIIEEFAKKKKGVLFDPCAGWGGRMLGTVASGWKYIGCEPNKETYKNLKKMISFLEIEKQVELYSIPAENYDYKEKVDVVLTSPPYFDLEIYTNDSEQSYNKYFDYLSWKEAWFQPLMKNCSTMLSKKGLSCWNVMDFKKHDLVNTVMKFHDEHKFSLINTVGFQSPLANIRNLKNRDVTYIFESA